MAQRNHMPCGWRVLSFILACQQGCQALATSFPDPTPSPTSSLTTVSFAPENTTSLSTVDNTSSDSTASVATVVDSPSSVDNAHPTITATGLESFSSCAQQLSTWRHASREFVLAHGTPIVTSYSFSTTVTRTFSVGIVEYERGIQLCDGHARIVGQASRHGDSFSIYATLTTESATVYGPGATYPTPAPCTVPPSDCTSVASSISPSCQTTPAIADTICQLYSTECGTTSTPAEPTLTDPSCTIPIVTASSANLLYWPNPTEPGQGNNCDMSLRTSPGSPTAPPDSNTFVADGMTITSPTVALVIQGISRVDGCGPTVTSTVLPIRPEDLTSIRGGYGVYEYKSFNFADLVYYCREPAMEMVTAPPAPPLLPQDRQDCFLNVPADAYLSGQSFYGKMMYPPSEILYATIYPDYAPQLALPQTISDSFQSVYGSQYQVNFRGMWGTPRALSAFSYTEGRRDIPADETPGAVQPQPTVDGVTRPWPITGTSSAGAVQARPTVDGVTTPIEFPTPRTMVTAVPSQNKVDGVTVPNGGETDGAGGAGVGPVAAQTDVDGITRPLQWNFFLSTITTGPAAISPQAIRISSAGSNAGQFAANQASSAGSGSESDTDPSGNATSRVALGDVVTTQGQTLTVAAVDVSTYKLIGEQTTVVVTIIRTSTSLQTDSTAPILSTGAAVTRMPTPLPESSAGVIRMDMTALLGMIIFGLVATLIVI